MMTSDKALVHLTSKQKAEEAIQHSFESILSQQQLAFSKNGI